MVFPDSHTDTFTYNGLGLRVGKTDPTGTYVYICDGASPGAAVLSDGAAVYTPGLSEHRLSGSYTGTRFAHADMLGSLTFLSDSTQTSTAGYGFDAYGSLASSWFPNGADPTPFGWLGDAGCLTDHDSGLVLMGYRYYDTRTGSFITQDPAGDGDNWYAYAGNNPVTNTDPSGLSMSFPGTDESRAHDGIAGFLGAVEAGGWEGQEQWDQVNAAEERGQQEYIQSLAAQELSAENGSDGAQLTFAMDKGHSAFGFIVNDSLESIVIEFDKNIQTATHPNGIETLWRVTLDPGFESTPFGVDVDFVLLPKSQGGFWAHLLPFISYKAIDLFNGQQIITPGIFRPDQYGNGLFPKSSGYPYLPSFVSGTMGAYNRGFVMRNSPNFGYPFAPSI